MNYNLHEILTIIPVFCVLATIFWLFILIKDGIEHKDFKSNMITMLLLSVLLIFQANYIISESNLSSISTVAKVLNIDSQKEKIVITNGSEEIVLDCPMTIFVLLEEDKEYLISYLYEKENPSKGKVSLIKNI